MQRDLIFYVPECPVGVRKPCGQDLWLYSALKKESKKDIIGTTWEIYKYGL